MIGDSMNFTAEQLDEAFISLENADSDFPKYPLLLNYGSTSIYDNLDFPIKLREVGNEKNVVVAIHERFDGEEGGDHRVYIIFRVGYGDSARYFEKTGEYNSWEDSTWFDGLTEVVPKEVKKIEWVSKK